MVAGTIVVLLPSIVWPPRPGPTIDTRTLGRFRFDPRSGTLADVPADLRRLDGRRVTVIGYAYAGSSPGGGPYQLTWTRHDWEPPQVQDRVFAAVVPGPTGAAAATTLDGTGPSTVAATGGVFHVRVERDERGYVARLFSLDADRAGPWVPGVPPPAPVWVMTVRWAGVMVMVGSVLTVAMIVRDRRRRWVARLSFCCPVCGYDLRATPGRCPECGRVTIPSARDRDLRRNPV